MIWEGLRRLREAVESGNRLLDVLDRRMERMETVLLIREPASVSAADSYDGLRKQVGAAMGERLAHLSQLAQLDAALRRGADTTVLQRMADGWLADAGVTRTVQVSEDSERELLFDLVESSGERLEVLLPAYVDSRTGRVVRQGQARLVPVVPPDEVVEPVPATDSDETAVES